MFPIRLELCCNTIFYLFHFKFHQHPYYRMPFSTMRMPYPIICIQFPIEYSNQSHVTDVSSSILTNHILLPLHSYTHTHSPMHTPHTHTHHIYTYHTHELRKRFDNDQQLNFALNWAMNSTLIPSNPSGDCDYIICAFNQHL